ncbi:alpha/beta hydrolase [Skermania sp. ID1734]|uniref:alpha/beta fold hydrolase n=1 Tax=Skermania sp. ID1734 TaxID=2597516 RepID=UPI00117D1E46|nr:alpha/beta hydrolase [Skermania sp. ID1734]TSE01107.1 alpha/beta hydrolase [Skermania sp. ID1734]
MGFVRVRGARFHTVDLGSDGPDVVMVHGLFTGSVASWYLTAAPLLSEHARVRLLDWRGHGLSERTPSGYGSEAMAADLAALTADLSQFTLVGHSFGAIVATRFARAWPERVAQVVLVDPPLGPAIGSWWTPRETELIAARAAALDASTPPARREPANTIGKLLAHTSVTAELEAESPFGAAQIAEIGDVPVLVVVGSESPFRAAADALTGVHPRLEQCVLPGGHDVHVESKQELAKLLSEIAGEPEVCG